MTPRLGIDLGGTKIEALAMDVNGAPLYRRRVETPAQDYARILDSVVQLVVDAEARLGETVSVGIGLPGALSPASGLLRNSNTVCLNGKPVADDLQARLGRQLRFENDANCFALSEARDGAARGYDVVFGVIVGTGTGGAIVVGGRLLAGPHAIGGEWGHNPLPWIRDEDGLPTCYCGKRGCIETFLSGPGLSRNYQTRFGAALSSREIVAGAAAGDESCSLMMAAWHDQMARALAHLINILDPDAIVFGGGMSNVGSLYREVPPLLPKYVFSDFVCTPLLEAEHGDASGVRGAAMLWPN